MEALPAIDGFYLPADWLPAERAWMAWPSRLEAWGEDYEAGCLTVAAMARRVADFQPVTMIAPPQHAAVAMLQLARKVTLKSHDADDCMVRDFGPVFLTDGAGGRAAVTCRFNGWGNRYHGCDDDAACARWIAEQAGAVAYDCPLTLEGGAVSGDGAGTLLVTADVLLNSNRNPTLDQRQIEERLALYFGVRRVIWLEGLAHDGITAGQVIEVARFIGPGRVACAVAADGDGDDVLGRNLDLLRSSRDALGQPLEIVEVPCAVEPGGHRPLSYLGFCLVNEAVLIPAYGSAQDAIVVEILSAALPRRDVVQMPMQPLRRPGCAPHSLLLQQPQTAG